MVVMYNPQDARYTDEMSVRHEISRVFDACFSCKKCVETCGVFPSLVSAVEGCQGNDASLLTPEQQDNIIESCHMCMQCVVQCPFSQTTAHDEVTSLAIRFPELVVRHRTMLWSQGFVDLRQRWLTYLVSYWPYVVHRFSLIRRWSYVRRFVRSIMSHYVDLLFVDAAHNIKARSRKRHEQTSMEQVVVFPTCVINEFQPQVVNDFVDAGRELHFGCIESSSLVCCGAPLLYAGDMKGFRRTAKRNISRLLPHVRNGSKVVVGQPSCLGVMKQLYPVVASSVTTSLVIESLCDVTQFVTDKIPDVHTMSDDVSQYVILQSSTQQFINVLSGEDDRQVNGGLTNVLSHTSGRVSMLPYASFAENVWSSQNRFHNDVATGVNALGRRLSGLDHEGVSTVVLGDSCLAAIHLSGHTGRDIVHPVSWITQQLKGSAEASTETN